MPSDRRCRVDEHIVMTGALSPTEVMAAVEYGSDVVKIFPASLGGPAYLKALRGPFPAVPLMPTGGVGPGNIGDCSPLAPSPSAQGATWSPQPLSQLRTGQRSPGALRRSPHRERAPDISYPHYQNRRSPG